MDDEKTGIQLKTNSSFTWQQIRWAAVVIVTVILSGFQARDWLTTYSIQQATDSTNRAVVHSVSEIEQIKKDLSQARAELKQYRLALDSWNDFFAEEQLRQNSPIARERYKQQRIRIKKILEPTSKMDKLFANPILPLPSAYPTFGDHKNE